MRFALILAALCSLVGVAQALAGEPHKAYLTLIIDDLGQKTCPGSPRAGPAWAR